MNAWLLAWRNIQRNRRRSLVTIAVAAMGCLAVLVASGFALYTYEQLEDGAAREFGHITIADKDYFTRDEEILMQYGIEDYQTLIGQVARNPHVRSMLPRVSLSGLISNGEKSLTFLGYGADIAGEAAILGHLLELKSGALVLSESTTVLPGVLLGSDLAKSLNARPGSELTLLATTVGGSMNAFDVTVLGIVSTGWREIDLRLVYMDVSAAQRLLDSKRISTLSVYLDSTDATPEVLAELTRSDAAHAYKPWWDQAFYYHSVRGLYNRIFGLLGLIIASLVFFSVSNTLTMAVVERTREIGTLRALGALPEEIVGQFLREGALIGIVSVLIGTAVAWITALILPFTGLEMPPPPGRSVGYPLLINVSLPLYLLVDAIIIALCATAAWFASRKSVRKAIVEALAHV